MKQVKIFFPLDVETKEKAKSLIEEVGPYVDVIKVGLELEKNIGAPEAIRLAKTSGKEVFADFKLHDIPNTVKGAAKGITAHGVDYLNVMACGGKSMMQAGVDGVHEKAKELKIPAPKVIAVTVLTSLQKSDLEALGISGDVISVVLNWAQLAIDSGVDCLLCSPQEIAVLRKKWPNIELICPGVRPAWANVNDQKRTMTPAEAVKAGANGLVIGRPILMPPQGKTRAQVVEEIRKEISQSC